MAFPDMAMTDAFRKLVPQPIRTAREVRPETVNFGFGGGGIAIVAANCDPYLIDIPFPCRIVWARLRALNAVGGPVAVTATVDVQLSSFDSFGASVPLHGSGVIPKLTAQSKADLSLAGWHIDLAANDSLVARLASFSGAAVLVSLVLKILPTAVAVGVTGVTNNALDPMTDNSGDPMVFRS